MPRKPPKDEGKPHSSPDDRRKALRTAVHTARHGRVIHQGVIIDGRTLYRLTLDACAYAESVGEKPLPGGSDDGSAA